MILLEYVQISCTKTMETTYTKAREHLAALLDRAVDDKDVIIIKRRGNRDVALIDASELASLMETAYLLRSPQNAARLLNALEWSKSRDLQAVEVKDTETAIADLKLELAIEEEKEG
jgi:antitoxin YefM